jgi:hypothetical protein
MVHSLIGEIEGRSAISTSDKRRSLEQINPLADSVYERLVRPTLRPEDEGKFVVVDVDTGDFEVDEDDSTAVMRLRARLPEGEFWLFRVGYPAAVVIRHAR